MITPYCFIHIKMEMPKKIKAIITHIIIMSDGLSLKFILLDHTRRKVIPTHPKMKLINASRVRIIKLHIYFFTTDKNSLHLWQII